MRIPKPNKWKRPPRRRFYRPSIRQRLKLACGCRIEPYDENGIHVFYCRRHTEFLYSPHYDGSDVIYFVTEDRLP